MPSTYPNTIPPFSKLDRADQCQTKHTTWSFISSKYVPNVMCFMSFPMNLQTAELLIYFESFFIHGT